MPEKKASGVMIKRKMNENPWSDFWVTEKATIGAAKANEVRIETPIAPTAPMGLVAMVVPGEELELEFLEVLGGDATADVGDGFGPRHHKGPLMAAR